MTRAAALALAFFAAAGSPAATAPEPKRVVLVRTGALVDVLQGRVLAHQDVLIEEGVVKQVGPGLAAPAGASVIDLSKKTVLPGLIDVHTHVTSQPEDYYADRFRRSPIDVAVTAHVYAKRTLEAGFTTVRVLGSPEYVDVALRNAIDKGQVAGPRLKVAGLSIGSTGGHGDLTGFSPYLKFGGFSGVADGVDAVRKLVRQNVKVGADVIKMLASAGVLSEEESVGAPQYSLEEMKAICDEAAMWGRKVAAHAHGTEAIKRAVAAGVASIEHGSLIDDEGIRMMKERGTYLVADVYNDDWILAEFAKMGYPE
ncbi:MAG: amidohydrolase family protein, partial [Acidobacteriota bacterium]